MAKQSAGRRVAKARQGRGPYKTEDPDQLGTGGIHLRQWRLYRGYTVAELSKRAGVSPGLISGAEVGNSGLSLESIKLLADALGCTPGMLMEIDPRSEPSFWPLWRDADKAQRQRITDHAKGVVDRNKQ